VVQVESKGCESYQSRTTREVEETGSSSLATCPQFAMSVVLSSISIIVCLKTFEEVLRSMYSSPESYVLASLLQLTAVKFVLRLEFYKHLTVIGE